jgi:hypothetical protein
MGRHSQSHQDLHVPALHGVGAPLDAGRAGDPGGDVNLSPDIRDHECGCLCPRCEKWRRAVDPEYRAAVEAGRAALELHRDHKHHFHAVVVSGLHREEIQIHATNPTDRIEDAHSVVVTSLRKLREALPQTAGACDHYLSLEPSVSGIRIGNSAFGVAECCMDAGDCSHNLGRLAEMLAEDFEAAFPGVRGLLAAAEAHEPEIGGYL